MESLKDASHLYEVERRAQHAARPGFRIQELQISNRPHLVANGGERSATFLILQGIGEYDFVPLVKPKSAA
jgi:hypothetical protein